MKTGLNQIRVDIIIFQILIMLYLFFYGSFMGAKFVAIGFLITALNLIYILIDLDKIHIMISNSEEKEKKYIMLEEEKNKSLEHIKKIRQIFKTENRETLIKYIEKSQREYYSEEIQEFNLEILNIIIQRYTFISKNSGIEFTYDIQKNVKGLLSGVNFSSEHLCTVLGNLLDNSVDVLKSKLSDRKIKLSIIGDEHSACVKVFNNGEKIPKKIKDKIFNYGFSTKSGGRGTGLFIVYRLVEKIGAILSVDSNDEQTCFEILFEIK